MLTRINRNSLLGKPFVDDVVIMMAVMTTTMTMIVMMMMKIMKIKIIIKTLMTIIT